MKLIKLNNGENEPSHQKNALWVNWYSKVFQYLSFKIVTLHFLQKVLEEINF